MGGFNLSPDENPSGRVVLQGAWNAERSQRKTDEQLRHVLELAPSCLPLLYRPRAAEQTPAGGGAGRVLTSTSP